MASAIKTQVGGNHYKDKFLQPIELSYILGATPCFCKLAKYLTRVKGDRLLDLQKAFHVIEMEIDLECFVTGKNQYPLETAEYFINKFTDDVDMQGCLISMYIGDYHQAKFYLNKIIDISKNMEKCNDSTV